MSLFHARKSNNNQNDDEDRERDTKAPNGDSAANHLRFGVLLGVGLIPFLAIHAIPVSINSYDKATIPDRRVYFVMGRPLASQALMPPSKVTMGVAPMRSIILTATSVLGPLLQ